MWAIQMNLSEVTHQKDTFLEFGLQKFLTRVDIKRAPDGSFISLFFCWKNNSTFKAHLKLCRHLLSTPFPLYVLERSFCEWKENIIYMHVLIRPVILDSRQLARQSCSAESKWKWKLRRIYSVTLTKKTKNPRCIIRLQSRLWGKKKHASWQTRHFRLPLRRLTGKLGL